MKKTEHIKFRCEKNMLDAAKERAKELEMPFSELVRAFVHDAAVIDIEEVIGVVERYKYNNQFKSEVTE